MKKIQFIIVSLLTYTVLSAQHTDQINSNRPGKSAGAFAVGKKVYQGEGGLFYIHENFPEADASASGFGVDLQGRAGVWREQFEITLDAQIVTDSYSNPIESYQRTGFKNLTLGAKYLFYDPFKKGEEKPNIYSWRANHRFKWKQFIPAVAGYVGINFAINNRFYNYESSFISPKVMAITQNHFGKKWVWVNNFIADKITNGNAFNYGLISTLTHNFNDKWTGFGELRLIRNDIFDDPTFTFGAAYLLKDNMQIDISISKNVENQPDMIYGGVGFSYRFDKQHKDVQIKDGKEVKETKEEKEKKSGIKSQEELDKIAEKANKKSMKKKKSKKDSDTEEAPTEDQEPKRKRLDQFDPNK
ncbi:MAG: transporter [Limnohabitans sp.]|nr:transporter [Limnohabitans sp.]